MQLTIHIAADQQVNVHAPPSTYYTTGYNSGGAVSRLKTFKDYNKSSKDDAISRRRRASHGMD
ncbi:unnamed protein product [Absidia cylindrospora]